MLQFIAGGGVMGGDSVAAPGRRLQHRARSTPGRSRIRPPAPVIGADLPDLDLRPGGAGQEQGLRVRAHPQRSRARRSSGTWRRSRAAPRGLCFASGLGRHQHAACRRCRPATTWWPGTISTAAPTGCSTRCSARLGLEFTFVATADPERGRGARSGRNTRLLFVETPTNPMMAAHRHRRGQRARTKQRHHGWWWTTRS